MQAKNTSTAYRSRLSGADTSLTLCTIDGVKPDNLTNFGKSCSAPPSLPELRLLSSTLTWLSIVIQQFQ